MIYKSCPFCGGQAHVFDCEETDNKGGQVIGCKKCLASTRVFFGACEGINDAWNTRASTPTPDLGVAVEALRAIRTGCHPQFVVNRIIDEALLGVE